MKGLVIAIVGAESTGKTALAQSLSQCIRREWKLHAGWVPEHLRQWCEREGRTPLAHEQAAIAHAQHGLITRAAEQHEVVVADTTPLMTAIYSRMLFGDDSLMPMALRAHAEYDLTLVTANDVPWQADGLQRDGPHVREPVLGQVLEALKRVAGLPKMALVEGLADARLQSAVRTIEPALKERLRLLNRTG